MLAPAATNCQSGWAERGTFVASALVALSVLSFIQQKKNTCRLSVCDFFFVSDVADIFSFREASPKVVSTREQQSKLLHCRFASIGLKHIDEMLTQLLGSSFYYWALITSATISEPENYFYYTSEQLNLLYRVFVEVGLENKIPHRVLISYQTELIGHHFKYFDIFSFLFFFLILPRNPLFEEGEKFCIYTLSKTGQLTIQIGRRKMNSGSRNVRLGCAFED
ncbi:hypothetical protein T07_14594 [Trichinella nelsoni]|uniref:Uncharacterized protein n=1 Tax=Trichinella nelsoni TaxID=6336 RepID=A0A0V0SBH6_9BILA|nr:hypothetical protein T07_14594 [Trichinella nelsoni]